MQVSQVANVLAVGLVLDVVALVACAAVTRAGRTPRHFGVIAAVVALGSVLACVAASHALEQTYFAASGSHVADALRAATACVGAPIVLIAMSAVLAVVGGSARVPRAIVVGR